MSPDAARMPRTDARYANAEPGPISANRRGFQPGVPAIVSTAQRLAAVGMLGQHEPRLSFVQRVAVVDAAADWIHTYGNDDLAWALLDATCRNPASTGQTYLALLSPTCAATRGSSA